MNLDALELRGGKRMLCSPELAEASGKGNMTSEEIENKEAKFKAMVFLKKSEPSCHRGFCGSLRIAPI